MMGKIMPRLATTVALTLALGTVWVSSATADLACKLQAKEEYRACKADCKTDYRSTKLSCRNVDPACGLGCMAGRQACRDAVDAILDTGQLPPPGGGTLDNCVDGTDGCKARLQAAKDACGAPCAPGDEACDSCVDAAQVTSFVCRDDCRESWRSDPVVGALKDSCTTVFKACIGACPPLQ
jgi:hypothetical protein